jgi:hypothetical protein
VFGAPEYFIVQHEKLGVVVHTVDSGYYALMAVSDPARVTYALTALSESIGALQKEMG